MSDEDDKGRSRLRLGAVASSLSFGVGDVLLNGADVLLSLSDSLLPIASILVGRFGEAVGIDQDLALWFLILVGSLFIVHQLTVVWDRYQSNA